MKLSIGKVCRGLGRLAGLTSTGTRALSKFSGSGYVTGGGDEEAEDRPTTPWVRSVISGVDLMRNPKYNKGEKFLKSGKLIHKAQIC